jgi:hypothetical protein
MIQTGVLRARPVDGPAEVITTDSGCLLVSDRVKDEITQAGIAGVDLVLAEVHGGRMYQIQSSSWVALAEGYVLRERGCGCVRRTNSGPFVIAHPASPEKFGAYCLVGKAATVFIRADVVSILRRAYPQVVANRVFIEGESDAPASDVHEEPAWMKFMSKST